MCNFAGGTEFGILLSLQNLSIVFFVFSENLTPTYVPGFWFRSMVLNTICAVYLFGPMPLKLSGLSGGLIPLSERI